MPHGPDVIHRAEVSRHDSTTSLRALWVVAVRRRRLMAAIMGSLLLACLVYCMVAPNQYEASARVELRTFPASSLKLDSSDNMVSASVLSAPTALETTADVFRSDRLAWRVIEQLKLYEAAGFRGDFASRFPGFLPDRQGGVDPAAQAWLLERFEKQLRVETLAHTLLIEIRFRSKDAALSAAVVNALIAAYNEQDSESQVEATEQASDWLNGQLKELKTKVDQDGQRLAAFEKEHGILSAPETLANGMASETEHSSALVAFDELSREMVAATTDRILREAEYRAATTGDPELVVASDARLQTADSGFVTAPLQQIHARRTDLEQERAQLSAEHGENFPRVVEIGRQLQDLDRQKRAEDAKLVERFRSAWQTAVDRERLVRKSLDDATGEGMRQNQAATEYAVMRQEANSSHDLYMRVQEKVEEAGFAAGIHNSNIAVIDAARQPVKPVAPDLPLYMAITFFAGLWVALGGALLMESLGGATTRTGAAVLVMALAMTAVHAQAPTPSTSGLPTGVARIPQTTETRSVPNPKDAPTVWNSPGQADKRATAQIGGAQPAAPAIIGPGDLLEISEYHTPEFRSAVRVAVTGTVLLPMIGEVQVGGLDEQAAARTIEAALVSKGMLLHPLVSVVVTVSAGQDVNVMGEVARPGIYPYLAHHRLLDVISEASGLTAGAGRLVNVFHRSDPVTAHPVALDLNGTDATADHNPELSPGDTVQVSRAGLVYVVGDVIRPGGFPVDPVHGLTLVQALALAWGPTQNAATAKGLLIREQKGGRTLTALNLKRLLRGQDPDLPVEDGDIVFVPDSAAKNLLNRTMESAVQSAVGVTIYSGLVYSQRY
ncbi:MAG: polysaccharide biosynthesis/export family protein [Terracidiphilus sp.]|nr:polysaccharide biosynthesis/export family protein [Terracidiphilus sp.]